MSVIVKAWCYNSHLKQLNIKNTGISETEAGDIATVVRCNSSIELLSICDDNLNHQVLWLLHMQLKFFISKMLICQWH